MVKNDSGIQVWTDKLQYDFIASEKKFKKVSQSKLTSRLEDLLPGIYKSVVLNNDYEFYPVYNGFAFKYLRNNTHAEPNSHSLTLRKIEAFRNQEEKLIFPGMEIPFLFNNLRIEYIVPNCENVLYQYKLGDEMDWSDWSQENTFEFVGLHPGKHEILVRALVQGEISKEQSVFLGIIPPMYRKWYAYLLYVLLILSIIYFIREQHNKALKKQKYEMLLKERIALRELAEKHRHKLRQIEQERLQVEYEELKHQLKNKTVELAKKARDNEEKNRLILSLKESCERALNNPVVSKLKLTEMQKTLQSYLNVEDRTFEIQMDELHQDFFRELKKQFPLLSSNDLRLCAYLKIGLNSKEIAEILNILPSSSYISRSRLRKKLNLQADEDLYSFLNRF